MTIIKAFAVIGDQGNIGPGSVLGIFTDPDVAKANAKGRGSLDCGGNGEVREYEAVQFEDGSVRLLTGRPMILNEIRARGAI